MGLACLRGTTKRYAAAEGVTALVLRGAVKAAVAKAASEHARTAGARGGLKALSLGLKAFSRSLARGQ